MQEKENLDTDEPTSGRINRRKFIQTLSVAGGTVAGTTGSATIFASEHARAAQRDVLKSIDGMTAKQAIERYDNPALVETAVKEQSSEFLTKLEQDGYLDESRIDSFDFTTLKAPWETIEAGRGVATAAIPIGEGEYVPQVTLLRPTQKGPLEVTVIPDLNKHFATLNPRNDEKFTPLEENENEITPAEFCNSKKICFEPYRICSMMAVPHRYRVTHCSDGDCRHSFLRCCNFVDCRNKYICGC